MQPISPKPTRDLDPDFVAISAEWPSLNCLSWLFSSPIAHHGSPGGQLDPSLSNMLARRQPEDARIRHLAVGQKTMVSRLRVAGDIGQAVLHERLGRLQCAMGARTLPVSSTDSASDSSCASEPRCARRASDSSCASDPRCAKPEFAMGGSDLASLWQCRANLHPRFSSLAKSDHAMCREKQWGQGMIQPISPRS